MFIILDRVDLDKSYKPFLQKHLSTVPNIMQQESQLTGQIVWWNCIIPLFSYSSYSIVYVPVHILYHCAS